MAERLALACAIALLPVSGCGSQTTGSNSPQYSALMPPGTASEQLYGDPDVDYEATPETEQSVENAEHPETETTPATPNRTTPEVEKLVQGPDSSVDEQTPAPEVE